INLNSKRGEKIEEIPPSETQLCYAIRCSVSAFAAALSLNSPSFLPFPVASDAPEAGDAFGGGWRPLPASPFFFPSPDLTPLFRLSPRTPRLCVTSLSPLISFVGDECYW
ncbi:hypothetical protein U1Q18_025279, partial [Sarracenia purpurea var. burkii]